MDSTFVKAAGNWNEMGRLDPCWAILVDPARKYGGWETEDGQKEFFATGEEVIDRLMRYLEGRGVTVSPGKSLDFGCGVGRLTRALAARFESCDGVDISESMVSRARELNAGIRNCRFHVNPRPDLQLFESESFDFIFSTIVLQHVPTRLGIERYIAEFVRLLRPGGVMAFQLPSYIPWRRRIQPRRRLYEWLRTVGVPGEVLYGRFGLMPIPMSFVPEAEIVALLEREGAEVVDVVAEQSAGPEIESRLYIASKPHSTSGSM